MSNYHQFRGTERSAFSRWSAFVPSHVNAYFQVGTRYTDALESLGWAEGREAVILNSLPEAVERERRFDTRWYQLLRRQVWRTGTTWSPLISAQVQEDAHQKEISDWRGETPWPCGTTAADGVTRLWLGFCRFVWQLPISKFDAPYSMLLNIIGGVLPVVFSSLMSFTILAVQQTSRVDDTAGDNGTPSRRPDPTVWGSTLGGIGISNNAKLALLLCSMAGVAALRVRLDWEYQENLPMNNVKANIRTVLQRQLLKLNAEANQRKFSREDTKTKRAAARLTPSSCSQTLDVMVHETVFNLWGGLFTLVQFPTSMLASLVSGYVMGDFFGIEIVSIYVCSHLVALLSAALTGVFYLCPLLELSILKTQWNVRYGSLAGAQIAHIQTRRCDTPEERQAFSEAYGRAAFVYQKRAFQLFFMQLTMQDVVRALDGLVRLIALFILGSLAMDPGAQVSAGVFAAGASLIFSGFGEAERLAGTMSSILYGTAALVCLSDVFNEGARPMKKAALVTDVV